MKRVFLFLATNLAIVLVLSVVTSLLGVNRWLTANGLNYQALLIFCFVFGMGGAFISLALSKTIAKWSTGAKVLKEPRSSSELWRSEEHTSELQSTMRTPYAVVCL